ncbi:hypothetical protein NDU88_001788 [Pleurodeles waltl]|uniref:WAP domain-containing protein n=1 Tax=Pleurodeles waltl TaxID=8319 RepID=A0AAV7P7U7_PLEWA|nr:hypothetical protein NDU88_001788 [Pleurodeles waltl]
MKRGGRTSFLLLAAVLALWGLHTACGQTTPQPTTVMVKPGLCPPERYANLNVVRSNSTYCHNDGECPTDKKCCKDNFDMICKVPAADRPGTCPPEDPSAERKDDFCTSDSECAEGCKCCFVNGQKTCLPTVGEKEGYCKPNPIRCFIPGRYACVNDSGCPKDEKCCSSQCATQCLPPLKERPGVCPPERVHAPDRFNDSFCNSDKDCLMDQKCCLDNGDKFCKPRARDKLGECPPAPSSKSPTMKREDFCTSDSECVGDLKCCLAETGRTCLPSLLEAKPGVCPPHPICIRGARATCTNDSGCVEDLKCCNFRCGTACVKPLKGFCPPNVLPPGIGATTCDVKCDNCSETEMCCSYGCSLICRPMSKERPGFCPFDPKLCLPTRFECKSDLDCPDNKKCCDYDCERKCVPLLNEKPGTCPLMFNLENSLPLLCAINLDISMQKAMESYIEMLTM